MSAPGPTTRSKPERPRIRQMFSALPPKADLPPDLRATPAASLLAKRRHRVLARRRMGCACLSHALLPPCPPRGPEQEYRHTAGDLQMPCKNMKLSFPNSATRTKPLKSR